MTFSFKSTADVYTESLAEINKALLQLANNQIAAQAAADKLTKATQLKTEGFNEFGKAVNKAGEELANWNKRSHILAATIKALNKQGVRMEFFSSLGAYRKEGGNILEYLAEFMAGSREELTFFGVEAMKARKVLYGFMPPGMFRIMNKMSSVFQFFGGILRKVRDTSEDTDNMFLKMGRTMSKLTRTRKKRNEMAQKEADIQAKLLKIAKRGTKGPLIKKDAEFADKHAKRFAKIRLKREKLLAKRKKATDKADLKATEKALWKKTKLHRSYYKNQAELANKAVKALPDLEAHKQMFKETIIGKRPEQYAWDSGVSTAKKKERKKEIKAYDAKSEAFNAKSILGKKKLLGTTSAVDDKLFDLMQERLLTEEQYTKAMTKANQAMTTASDAHPTTVKVNKLVAKVSKTWGLIKSFFRISVMSMVWIVLSIIAALIVLQALWPSIKKAVGPMMEMVKVSMRLIWTGLSDIWEGVFGLYTAIFKGGSIMDIFKSLWVIVVGLWNVVLGILGVLVGSLMVFLGAIVVDLVAKAWEHWKTLKKDFKSAKKIWVAALAIIGMIIAFLLGAPIIVIIAAGILMYKFGNWLIKKFKNIIPGNAEGGIVRGLSIVGERGPELVSFGTTARVHSNADSKKMLSSGGGTVNNFNITINAKDTSDVELRRIADKIGSMVSNKINRRTSSGTMS